MPHLFSNLCKKRINEDYRPVKLEKFVIGYNYGKDMTEFKFDMTLNYKLSGIIRKYSNGKPTLIVRNRNK